MHDLENKNETRSMMKTDYTDVKLDKEKELNSEMTIKHTEEDEYTRTIKNIGGKK